MDEIIARAIALMADGMSAKDALQLTYSQGFSAGLDRGISIEDALRYMYSQGFSAGLDRGISVGIRDAQAAAQAKAEIENPPSNWHAQISAAMGTRNKTVQDMLDALPHVDMRQVETEPD
jgi:hypothetical protein